LIFNSNGKAEIVNIWCGGGSRTGHNWGSPHDPEIESRQCAPAASSGGKYIMYPISVTGSDKNNMVSRSSYLVWGGTDIVGAFSMCNA